MRISRRQFFAYLADHDQIDGRATAYICRNCVCKLPVDDPLALARQLAR